MMESQSTMKILTINNIKLQHHILYFIVPTTSTSMITLIVVQKYLHQTCAVARCNFKKESDGDQTC